MKKRFKKIASMSVVALLLCTMTSAISAYGISPRSTGTGTAEIKMWQEVTVAKFSGSTIKETENDYMGLSVTDINGVERVNYWPIKVTTSGNYDLVME